MNGFKAGWIGVLVMIASTAMAEVTLDFNVDAAFADANRLYNGSGGSLTFVFSVDGSGNVTMTKATTSSDADVISTVNSWSSSVGSVTNSAFFNTSFTLQAAAWNSSGNANITLQGNDTGLLAVQGQNSGRIDGLGLAIPKPESLGWTLSAPPGLKVLMTSFTCGNAHPSGALRLTDSDTDLSYSMPGSSAAFFGISSDGFQLSSGETLTFSADTLLGEGAGLSGFTFELFSGSVVPPTAEIADLTPDSRTAYTTQLFDGRTVWVSGNTDGQLYFNVPGTFDFTPGQPVYVRIEYHDTGAGRLFVEYDSNVGDNYKDSEVHSRSSRVDGGGFVYSYQMFESPEFAGGQNGGNDFRFSLRDTDGTPLRIASVQISTAPYTNLMFQFALSEPWLTPYDGEIHDLVDNQTLAGKVMTGYQGWFGTPNDVMDEGWNHWGGGRDAEGVSRGVSPSEKWMTVDSWPYLDDYSTDNLCRAGDLQHQDGRQAYLFSSRDPETVQRHFQWMRKHGIDGAYLQFFVNASRSGANGGKQFVLNNVMEAAAKEGRIWALEYDISGLSTNFNEAMSIMTNDWNWMVNEAKITQDPRYAHEDGKPVVFIWGFGVREHSVELSNAVIDWFAAQNLYLICGTRWKTEPEWQDHFKRYDQLLIWMERDLNTLISRKNTLDSWGMKILPHAWPGFSWHNLKMTVFPTSYTARDGGNFYWTRIYNAVACGADQIFLGMFDEYDEGTAIMPMSDNHPNIYAEWGHYIDNEGRDPFWYLQLSDAAREMLNGQRPLSPTKPAESEITPAAYGGDDATAYLGTNDVAAGLTHTQPPDGVTAGTFLGRQNCRTNSGSYYYFDIDDAFCFEILEGQAATIEAEYYDDTPNTVIRLQYDSLGSAYTTHPKAETAPGSGGWKTIRWNVDDGFFGNRQNGFSDFRIDINGEAVVAIRRVSIFLPEEQGGSPADAPELQFANGTMQWPELSDTIGWRLYTSDSLLSADWQEVTGVVFTNGAIRKDLLPANGAAFYRLQKPAKQ